MMGCASRTGVAQSASPAGASLRALRQPSSGAGLAKLGRTTSARQSYGKKELENKEKEKPIFWNYPLDKGKLKSFVSWFLKQNGEKKTLELLEQLKVLGFGYATEAGISLGIEDLKIPPNKSKMISRAQGMVSEFFFLHKKGKITNIEKTQGFIEIWNEVNESLKDEVVSYFRETDILNPVYMMAFSGARGNLSQVRQLVGMRGLMSDPQGKIIDFPILSNFREGLTLTEYLISTYGARKGIVDTALRTATAGYLTRRLVDVAQHVIVSKLDCGTSRGIFLFDMKDEGKTIYAFQNRLTGRVLCQDIYKTNSNGQVSKIASKNGEVDAKLAAAISKVAKKALVRSPLTCENIKRVCQLCYGWSLATSRLVSIGEAVGVIAGQSIGEPGTQLTMRTFHTGGVFAGSISEQINAPFDCTVEYTTPMAGSLIRLPRGTGGVEGSLGIAFLTKAKGTMVLKASASWAEPSARDSNVFLKSGLELNENRTQREVGLSLNAGPTESSRADVVQPSRASLGPTQQDMAKKNSLALASLQTYSLPVFTVLFARHGEWVSKKSLLAQVSAATTGQKNTQISEQTVYSALEGEVLYSQLDLMEDIDEKYGERVSKSENWAKVWILSAKLIQTPLPASREAQRANSMLQKNQNQTAGSKLKDFKASSFYVQDFISKKTVVQEIEWTNPIGSFMSFTMNENVQKDSLAKQLSETYSFRPKMQRISDVLWTGPAPRFASSTVGLLAPISTPTAPTKSGALRRSDLMLKVQNLKGKINNSEPTNDLTLSFYNSVLENFSRSISTYAIGTEKSNNNSRTNNNLSCQILQNYKLRSKFSAYPMIKQKPTFVQYFFRENKLLHVSIFLKNTGVFLPILQTGSLKNWLNLQNLQKFKTKYSINSAEVSTFPIVPTKKEEIKNKDKNIKNFFRVIENLKPSVYSLTLKTKFLKKHYTNFTEPLVLNNEVPFVLNLKTLKFLGQKIGRMNYSRIEPSLYAKLALETNFKKAFSFTSKKRNIQTTNGSILSKVSKKEYREEKTKIWILPKTKALPYLNINKNVEFNAGNQDLFMKEPLLSFPTVSQHFSKLGYSGSAYLSSAEKDKFYSFLPLKGEAFISSNFRSLNNNIWNKQDRLSRGSELLLNQKLQNSILRNTNDWQPKPNSGFGWYPGQTNVSSSFICLVNSSSYAFTFFQQMISHNLKNPKQSRLWQKKALRILNLAGSQVFKKYKTSSIQTFTNLKSQNPQTYISALSKKKTLKEGLNNLKLNLNSKKPLCKLKMQVYSNELYFSRNKFEKSQKNVSIHLSGFAGAGGEPSRAKLRAPRSAQPGEAQSTDVVQSTRYLYYQKLEDKFAPELRSIQTLKLKRLKIKKFKHLKVILTEDQKSSISFNQMFYLPQQTYLFNSWKNASLMQFSETLPQSFYAQNSNDMREMNAGESFNKMKETGKKHPKFLLTNYQGSVESFALLGCASRATSAEPETTINKKMGGLDSSKKRLSEGIVTIRLQKKDNTILTKQWPQFYNERGTKQKKENNPFYSKFFVTGLQKQKIQSGLAKNGGLITSSQFSDDYLYDLKSKFLNYVRGKFSYKVKAPSYKITKDSSNLFETFSSDKTLRKNNSLKPSMLKKTETALSLIFSKNQKIYWDYLPFIKNYSLGENYTNIQSGKTLKQTPRVPEFGEKAKIQVNFKPGWVYLSSSLPYSVSPQIKDKQKITLNLREEKRILNKNKKNKKIIDLGNNLIDDIHLDVQKVLMEPIQLYKQNQKKKILIKEKFFLASNWVQNKNCRFFNNFNNNTQECGKKDKKSQFLKSAPHFFLLRTFASKPISSTQEMKTRLYETMKTSETVQSGFSYKMYKSYSYESLNPQTLSIQFVSKDPKIDFELKEETIFQKPKLNRWLSFFKKAKNKKHVVKIVQKEKNILTLFKQVHFPLYFSNHGLNLAPLKVHYNLVNPEWEGYSFPSLSLNQEKNLLFLKGRKQKTQKIIIQHYLNCIMKRNLKEVVNPQTVLSSPKSFSLQGQDWQPLQKLKVNGQKQVLRLREENKKIENSKTVYFYSPYFYSTPKFEFALNMHYNFFLNARLRGLGGWKQSFEDSWKSNFLNLTQTRKENFRFRRFFSKKGKKSLLSFQTLPVSKNFVWLQRLYSDVQKQPALGRTCFYSPYEGLVLKDYSLLLDDVSLTQETKKVSILNLQKTYNINLDAALLKERQGQKLILTKEDLFILKLPVIQKNSELSTLHLDSYPRLKTAAREKVGFNSGNESSYNQNLSLINSKKFKSFEEKQLFFNQNSTQKFLKEKLKSHEKFKELENDYFTEINLKSYKIIDFSTTYENKIYKLKEMEFGFTTSLTTNEDVNTESKYVKDGNEKKQPQMPNDKKTEDRYKFRIGKFFYAGDSLYGDTCLPRSGQVIHLNSSRVTFRKADYFSLSPKAIMHTYNEHPIEANAPVMTLPFETLKTGDIVQGIPKVEQYLEARTTIQGRLFLNSLPMLLYAIFRRYLSTLELEKAARQSFLKIQQILVDGVQRVYRSQGVGITDKHLEVIVRQMTSKVKIIYGGQTGFFPGELVDLDFVERVNQSLMVKVVYEPVVLGITRASLEVDSFLSAASFQQTTKVLTRSAIENKRDFLKGLKENLLVGNLLPAGTGYVVPISNTF